MLLLVSFGGSIPIKEGQEEKALDHTVKSLVLFIKEKYVVGKERLVSNTKLFQGIIQKKIQKVHARKNRSVDVSVLSATSNDLKSMQDCIIGFNHFSQDVSKFVGATSTPLRVWLEPSEC